MSALQGSAHTEWTVDDADWLESLPDADQETIHRYGAMQARLAAEAERRAHEIELRRVQQREARLRDENRGLHVALLRMATVLSERAQEILRALPAVRGPNGGRTPSDERQRFADLTRAASEVIPDDIGAAILRENARALVAPVPDDVARRIA